MSRSASRKDKLETKLRFGWTTGTCATAAVNAAYTAMLTGQFPDRVTIITPSGKNADLAVAETASGSDDGGSWFRAGIIKDAGDDPDVTDDDWTRDVKTNFKGRIVVAKDLMELKLPV